MAQNRDKRRAVVNTVMNLRIPLCKNKEGKKRNEK
jgi:hypothetical protein